MGFIGRFTSSFADSLTSLVAGLGTDRDKASSLFYGTAILDDMQLANAYRGAWLPKKIVDIPALDSCREWRDWQAEGDQIEAIEAEEKRLNVRGKVLDAMRKARLWGGAAVYIGTGDADASEPINIDRIKKGGISYLTVLTRRELAAGEIETDPALEWFGRPKLYNLSSRTGMSLPIHPSRLVVFFGQPNIDELTAINPGWGDSVLLPVMDAIRQADGTAANVASLVFEAKINVFRVPDFMANIGDATYRSKLLERYRLAATSKGINGDLILDKEEEFEQRTASFATLPEVMDRFLQIVSGAADIPATRLLGQSPAGMNATGESDIRNYYDRISAAQEIEMTPAMIRLDEALIRSATGARDPSIHYEWTSLWQLSEKERAEIAKAKAEATEKDVDSGLIPIDALAKGRQNQLIEDGTYPGLEGALEESSREAGALEEPDPNEAGILADPVGLAANDAAPRTLYVSRRVLNASEIIAWAKGQGFTPLPASEMHVTIIYTRTPMDWIKVGSAGEWSSEDDGKMTIAPGGPRLMERFGDATVLQFASSRLAWRHEDIVRMGAEVDFPEYQPHVTIEYGFTGDLSAVEPYQGRIVLGPEVFSEVKEDLA